MKKRDISGFAIVALIIVLLAIVVNHCPAQTVTHKRGTDGDFRWNNHAFFEKQPKIKFKNWSTYPDSWDGKQFVTWGMFALSGVMWGAREAYHTDPYVFEKTYDVQSESFWGSDAWKRNYVGNNPDLPHKKEWFGNVGRDVWHTFGFASNAVLLSGSFAIGARRQPWKYKGANFVIALATRSLFASLTYNAFR